MQQYTSPEHARNTCIPRDEEAAPVCLKALNYTWDSSTALDTTQEQLLDMLLYVSGIMLSILFSDLYITCLSTHYLFINRMGSFPHKPCMSCIFTDVSQYMSHTNPAQEYTPHSA